MEQVVYRINEFCARYAVSRRTFYREINASKLRVIKRGRRTLITRTDADAWLEKQHPTYSANITAV